MMQGNPWPRVLSRLSALFLLAALVGWWAEALSEALLLAALTMLAWEGYNLYRFEAWLRKGRQLAPPAAHGLWRHLFDALYQRQQRQRQRRRNLQRLMARYRDSARAMPDALVVLSGDYRIDWWNPAAARLLGLRWPGDSHQRIANIYRHPDFVAFLSSRSPVTREVSLPSPLDSQVWLEIRLVPYGTDRYLLLARDVTHLHRLETMRRDFVGNVSHELRTPLTVIYGVAETLNEEMADDPEVGDMLRLLQEQSERMRRLVDDLLLLSRLETGATPSHPEWVDMPRLLEELVEDGKALSGSRHHRFELTCEPGLLLEGCESELRSAFSNLIFNAVKYTPGDGYIGVRWYADKAGAHLSVTDNGIGIPAAHIPRLTERFYRVDSARSKASGGTGLGLAIVKHVLNRHRAQLTVRSQPGQGSTFICTFPTALLRRAGTRTARPPAS
ncbi:phosphate regulon sensor histidine kinase PhoR [Alkalilimnicola ehrlichii MLHE-1]|uniref:Phosphate regulon sensor protein PhoR n=1 Tax=Alkalilimnicola ehrlichii (strain ATCC BAA-1101 / DSM 17681 / MLHE-1) TaxID=187272 RepID=Q0A9M9_ALKEH|nr:phosphate regulon sensor histidine kinase PhoR [Alkalilimnicola ehrlichii]ABI56458.1 PAS/PAC sensor signal transduction histidine kinase [Alkalilimnicola ehrlichii MLHE-1]